MRIMLTLLLCFLSFAPLHAQENTFDTSLLFEAGVEVISTETITNAVAPSIDWDDDRREVIAFLDDRVAQYPYPDEVITLEGQFTPIWRDYVVFRGYIESYIVGFEPFVLNLQTGEFAHYEPRCGVNSPESLDYNLRDKLWVIETTPAGVYLCATLTGERTTALDLPQDFVSSGVVSLAPSFADAVFFSATGDVYSYSFVSEKVRRLGTLGGNVPLITGWADEYIVLNLRDGEQCANYVADLRASYSLMLIVETTPICAALIDYALVVFDVAPLSEESLLLTCSKTIYDIVTGEILFYDYGTLCQPDYGSEEGVGYYRAVDDSVRVVNLVRFDAATGEQETLYSGGEIEWVVRVSDDERFAVLLLDDDGDVDRLPNMFASDWTIEQPTLALVDLTADTILYQTEIPWDAEFSDSVLSRITMLRDDLLLVELRALELELIPNTDAWIPTTRTISTQLVTLTDGAPVTIEVGEVAAVMVDNARLLIWTDRRDVSTVLHVYDIATGGRTPILRAVDQAQYSVSVMRGESADTAVVTVYPVVYGVTDLRSGTRYTIRF